MNGFKKWINIEIIIKSIYLNILTEYALNKGVISIWENIRSYTYL